MNARLTAVDPGHLASQDNLANLVFDRLVTLNESAQPQPALAISWRHDPDFRRLGFQLRPGVKFHDGSPLTAVAAAAALERLGAMAQNETLVIRSEQSAPNCRPAGGHRSFDLEARWRWRGGWEPVRSES